MTTLGTMKVTDIQDKVGYSLVTFEIPDDCKQFLIEEGLRSLLTKAAEETKQKYGSVLPETVDNTENKVYNQDEAGGAGWIVNTGVQPVDDDVLVDTLWCDDTVRLVDYARYCPWDHSKLTHWRLTQI